MLLRMKKYFHTELTSNEPWYFKEIFKPMYIVTSLVGLFPYSVKFDRNKEDLTIIPKSIYTNTFCAVCFLLTVYAFLILHVRHVLLSTESSSMTDAIMTQINYILELATLVAFCTVTYICAFLNGIRYVKILNKFTSLWIKLSDTNITQSILSRLRFKIHVVTAGGLGILAMMQISINFTRSDSVWKMILVALSFNLPQMIQFITITFYYVLIMMLVALLSNLEENIVQLQRQQVNQRGGLVKVKTKPTLTLRQLELAYVKAFKIKFAINQAFQGPLLITTLQCFHSIVSEAHIIYHGLVVIRNFGSHVVVNCTVWIIYQLIKIYILSSTGNLLKNQGVKITQILLNIPSEKQDLRWFMEIQHFTTIISQQSTEMTLYDFFPLDATLMYNMLSATTMYLIILVQFDT